MPDTFDSLPRDLAAAHALILAERIARLKSEERAARAAADLIHAQATASSADALIARLSLEIEKLRRTLYGARSERKERLINQLEMQLEDAEADAIEDELAAERSAPSTLVKSFERKRPARKPFPEHLPRERVVIAAPTNCPCCGSTKLSKLGEDVTETLEVVPRQWKVIQTVRERFSCRQCEAITQPPAPFHVTPRGFAGPSLLAMILFEKFGQHQPLNRQSERYSREGVDLSLSTLADQVGACAAALRPLHAVIEAHVLAAERLHGDDTMVPILAKGQTETGRVWVYVRDDRPFGGKDPPAALFYASRDRTREHPERHLSGYAGILQADAFDGYNRLYLPDRKPGLIVEALCWSHARRKFFELADIAANARRGKNAPPISPIALEAVKRIDALFDIEREINGLTAEARLRARRKPWSRGWKAGCAPSAPNSRAMPRSPRRSTTCSRAGEPSPDSSMMAASVSRTTPPSARCAAWPWAGSRGCLLVQSAGRNGRPRCTRSSKPQSSITSIRKLGSPTFSPGSPTRRRLRSPSCYHGIGGPIPCTEPPRSRGLRRRVTRMPMMRQMRTTPG